MNDERTNVTEIGEVRKSPSAVLKVQVGDFQGRAFIYTQTWRKAQDDVGPGEATHGGMTLRPGTLAALLPVLEAALKVARDREFEQDRGGRR